jgi:hypothetical protein
VITSAHHICVTHCCWCNLLVTSMPPGLATLLPPPAGPSGSMVASTSAGSLLSQDHFPALPTMSKNQRKKQKEQQASLADQLRRANMPVRVINRSPGSSSNVQGTAAAAAASSSGAASSSAAVVGRSGGSVPSQSSIVTGRTSPGPGDAARASPAAEHWPALQTSGGPVPPVRQHGRTSSLTEQSVAAAVSAGQGRSAPLTPSRPAAAVASSQQQQQQPPVQEDFPSLSGSSTTTASGRAAGTVPPEAAAPRYTTVALQGPGAQRSGSSGAGTSSSISASQAARLDMMNDFPTLGQQGRRTSPQVPSPSSPRPATAAR